MTEQSPEPGREEWDDAVDQVACYPHEDDGRPGLVMFDEENPLAYIWSDYYGPPIDRYNTVDGSDIDSAEG